MHRIATPSGAGQTCLPRHAAMRRHVPRGAGRVRRRDGWALTHVTLHLTTDTLKSGKMYTIHMDEESYRQRVAELSGKIGANERKLAELQRELDRLESGQS